MRYADGPGTGSEIYVKAAPPRVWQLVTDIELPARFSPELRRVEWLDGCTAPRVGARFAGYNHNRVLGDWRTVSQVVELDAEHAFGWVAMDADGRFAEALDDPAKAMARWRFVLEREAGGTRLRQSVRIGPGRSGLSLAIDRLPDRESELIAGRLGELRAAIETTLRGIKARAEAGG